MAGLMIPSISELQITDVERVAALMREDFRPEEQPADYAALHAAGERTVLVARAGKALAAYVTLLRRSEYPRFAAAGCPEINDLFVGKAHRRRGIGRALVRAAESLAEQRGYERVGIGVWEHGDGAALRLYEDLGYRWDGQPSRSTPAGSIRYLVKELAPAARLEEGEDEQAA